MIETAVFLYIGSQMFLKIFLWSSLALLGLYIFILEGRIYFTKRRLKKILNKVTRREEISNEPDVGINISYTEKKISFLRFLFLLILVLTIILTITY